MGYSTVHVDDIEGSGPQPVAGPEGMTMIGIGARRGSYEPRGPF